MPSSTNPVQSNSDQPVKKVQPPTVFEHFIASTVAITVNQPWRVAQVRAPFHHIPGLGIRANERSLALLNVMRDLRVHWADGFWWNSFRGISTLLIGGVVKTHIADKIDAENKSPSAQFLRLCTVSVSTSIWSCFTLECLDSRSKMKGISQVPFAPYRFTPAALPFFLLRDLSYGYLLRFVPLDQLIYYSPLFLPAIWGQRFATSAQTDDIKLKEAGTCPTYKLGKLTATLNAISKGEFTHPSYKVPRPQPIEVPAEYALLKLPIEFARRTMNLLSVGANSTVAAFRLNYLFWIAITSSATYQVMNTHFRNANNQPAPKNNATSSIFPFWKKREVTPTTSSKSLDPDEIIKSIPGIR